MKTTIGFAIAIVLFIARLALAVIGLFTVWIIDQETNPVWGNKIEPEPPRGFADEWWYKNGRTFRNWWWNAIRNPTNNLRFLVDDPTEDSDDVDDFSGKIHWRGIWNVDKFIRMSGTPVGYSASRLVKGWTPEYWYLRKTKRGYFEIRIGWKHGKTPGFAPTFQLRNGS